MKFRHGYYRNNSSGEVVKAYPDVDFWVRYSYVDYAEERASACTQETFLRCFTWIGETCAVQKARKS